MYKMNTFMKSLVLFTMVIFCAAMVSSGETDKGKAKRTKNVVLIVNAKTVFARKESKETIKNVYTGVEKYKYKLKLLPVNQKREDIYEAFIEEILEMSPTAYKNILLKFKFSPEWSGPKVVNSSSEVIEFVAKKKTAIGYVWEDDLTGDEEGILILKLKTEE